MNNLNLQLTVNGELKQNGNTKDMLFKIPTLIAYVSKYFKLEYGDLILTGTPCKYFQWLLYHNYLTFILNEIIKLVWVAFDMEMLSKQI